MSVEDLISSFRIYTEVPTLWDKPDEAQRIMQEKTALELPTPSFNKLSTSLKVYL